MIAGIGGTTIKNSRAMKIGEFVLAQVMEAVTV